MNKPVFLLVFCVLLLALPVAAPEEEGGLLVSNCIYCDYAIGGATDRCNIDGLGSQTAARIDHWNTNIVAKTYSVENPCLTVISRARGSYDFNLSNNVRLEFGSANLTMYFDNVYLGGNTFLGSGSSCAGTGNLELYVADTLRIGMLAQANNSCGNLTVEANTVYLDDGAVVEAGGWLTIRTNKLMAHPNSKIIAANGSIQIIERTPGGGDESQIGTLWKKSAPCPWCCPLNQQCADSSKYALYVKLPAQEVFFAGTALAPAVTVQEGDAAIISEKLNISKSFSVQKGRLFVEGGDAIVAAPVTTAYLQSFNLTGTIQITPTGSLESQKHAVSVFARGNATNRVEGGIRANNQRPDLEYPSRYPGMLNNSIRLGFVGDAVLNASINTSRGRAADELFATVRNATIEGRLTPTAADVAAGRLAINASRFVRSETFGTTTYNYNSSPSSVFFYYKIPPMIPSGSVEVNALANEFNSFPYAVNNSAADVTLIWPHNTPRPRKYSWLQTGNENAETIAVGLFVKNASITDGSSCNQTIENMMNSSKLVLYFNETASASMTAYNFSNYSRISFNAGEHTCSAWLTADNSTCPAPGWECLLKWYPTLWFAGVSGSFKGGTKYYYKIKACSPNPAAPGDCVETKTMSFIADAAPMSVGAVVLRNPERVADNFAFSAKIEHLTADDSPGAYGDERVGMAAAGLLFRVNSDAASYLLKLSNLGMPGNKTLQLYKCSSTNASFFAGTTPTPGGSLCGEVERGWVSVANSSFEFGTVSEAQKYPFAAIPSGYPDLRGYYLKVEGVGCRFKAYWSQDGNFDGVEPFIDYYESGCASSGSIGFWSMDSRTRFSDVKYWEPPAGNADADIAITAQNLDIYSNADIRADYQLTGDNPTDGSGGSLFLFGRTLTIKPVSPVDTSRILADACTAFGASYILKPYFYTNPCNVKSKFYRLACAINTNGIADNNTAYNARAPTEIHDEFCMQDTPGVLFGVVKNVSTAAGIAGGAVWVQRIRDKNGNSINVSNAAGALLSRFWASVFNSASRVTPSSLSTGLVRLRLGAGADEALFNPRLYLFPLETYYLDVWVSDDPDDDFNLGVARAAKRHRYTVVFRT
ncbi:MAG: hypothetical protein AB1626_03985 [Candidatus Micrarchaeota archaeon]